MLSKVYDNTQRTIFTSTQNFQNNSTIYTSGVFKDEGKLSINYQYAGDYYYLNLYVKNTLVEQIYVPTRSGDFLSRTSYFNTIVWAWAPFYIKVEGGSSNSQCYKPKIDYTPINNAKWKPRIIIKEIKDIGALVVWTIFWVIGDKFIGGVFEDKSSFANTWAIAPWNYVGYITVLLNWEYIKIPYYNA